MGVELFGQEHVDRYRETDGERQTRWTRDKPHRRNGPRTVP